jgi:hypothetical protein
MMNYGDVVPQGETGPASSGGDQGFQTLDNFLDDSANNKKTGSPHRRRHRYPDPINSDITRDHWLEMPGCYDRNTCMPVHHKENKDTHGHHRAHHFSRQDYHQCSKTWKYTQYHDDCCFFHSLGALEGGENKSPEGCTRELWPEDSRYYEGRQNYAQK